MASNLAQNVTAKSDRNFAFQNHAFQRFYEHCQKIYMESPKTVIFLVVAGASHEAEYSLSRKNESIH